MRKTQSACRAGNRGWEGAGEGRRSPFVTNTDTCCSRKKFVALTLAQQLCAAPRRADFTFRASDFRTVRYS